VCLILSPVSGADFAGLPMLRGVSFQGVRIPLSDPSNVSPELILEIQKIDIQAKKFDFLSLPSVPQMVFHGVMIIVAANAHPALALKRIYEFSKENPQFQNGRLEEVTLVDPLGKILLSAHQGSMSRSGSTLILREVSFNLSKPNIIAEGRLELIGPDSGKLLWDESGMHHSCTVLPSPQ
jgi:hypothetical protein